METLTFRKRLRSTLFYTPRPMKLIEHNPFRMLGVPVNACARDIAFNKGKMRLLEVGKGVSFPLDLPNISSRLLAPVERTSERVNEAERNINLPQDKIKYALFWFAQPSDPLGKLAYDHLMQGNIEKAKEIFEHSNSWEAKLCFATLSNLCDDAIGAINAISELIDYHCSAFIQGIVGKTFSISSEELRHIYLDSYCSSIGGISSIKFCSGLEEGSISSTMRNELRDISIDVTVAEIENEISAAKKEGKSNPEDNLDALNRLRWLTQSRVTSVREVLGDKNPRYRHLSDRLAELLRSCSIKYYNSVHNSQPTAITQKVVDTCLEIVEYAISICYGKSLHEKLDEDLKFLQEKKGTALPDLVEEQISHISKVLKKYETFERKTISDAISLMKNCASHVVLLKEHPEYRNYYLSISTKIVNLALTCVIEEHNRVSKEEGESSPPNENRMSMYRQAMRAILMMDEFDVEDEFREDRYKQNRDTLRSNAEKDWVDLKLYGVWVDFDEVDLRTEDEVFNDCCTSADYLKYLSRYNNPKHKTKALAEIQHFHAEEERRRKQMEEAEERRKRIIEADDATFYSCKTYDDYREYLKSRPNGRHSSEAKKKMMEPKIKRKMKLTLIAIVCGIIAVITICGLIWGVEGILVSILIASILFLIFVFAVGNKPKKVNYTIINPTK